MSILFEKYQEKNPEKAGYLRIGSVVLSTPPVDILTNRVVNNDRLTTLRGRNDMVKKTGQSRWDVTVRWIAVLDSAQFGNTAYYRQYNELRQILAMFMAAPFVEVENGFIRQVLTNEDPLLGATRMGFALRQLRISKHNDIVDGLDIALTMTLFNYLPYSFDFGYLGNKGQSDDAWRSDAFKEYLDNWVKKNLDAGAVDGTALQNWQDQTSGTLSFRWREYTTVNIGGTVTTDVTGGVTPTPQAAVASNLAIDLSNTAGHQPLSMIMAKIQAKMEGYGHAGNRPTRDNNPGDIATKAGGDLGRDSLGINIYSSAEKGWQVLVSDWDAKIRKYPNRTIMDIANRIDPPDDHKTPLLKGNDPVAYANGIASRISKELGFKVGINSTLAQLASYAASGSGAGTTVLPPLPAAPAPVAPLPIPGDTAGTFPYNELTAEQKQQVQTLIQNGYAVDHWVNSSAFFYREKQIKLTDTNHGDVPNGYNLLPTQFALLFVNNLAQIPLAGYQYPTYQHIGSASTKISIVAMSPGSVDDSGMEPLHPGIRQIAAASEFLEGQYLRYRNMWRSTSSVHRMQAFYVENQLLNMLGIRGMMIDQINTASLPDQSNVMQVEIAGAQYENVFEVSTPYKINAIDKDTPNIVSNIITSGSLNNLSAAEKQSVSELSDFAALRSNGSLAQAIPYIIKVAKSLSGNFSTLHTLAASPITYVRVQDCQKALSGATSSSVPSLLSACNSAVSSGKVSVGDCAMLLAILTPRSTSSVLLDDASAFYVTNASKNGGTFTVDMSGALTSVQEAVAGITKDQVQSVYDALLPLLMNCDANFASNVNALASSPKYATQFASTSPAGPGSNQENTGHGAYRDMGLDGWAPVGTDISPGTYFYDYNAEYQEEVRSILESVVNASAVTSNTVNAQTRDTFDVQITESMFVGQNADTNSLVRSTNIPGYRMAEAFPTFKLFLIEDESQGLVQAFDNFYSYASVVDFEIMRYKNQPDLARIQITNLANILQHKLYNNTPMGRYEYKLSQFGEVDTPNVTTPGQVTGGPPDSALIAGRSASGQAYQSKRFTYAMQGKDLRDGPGAGDPSRIPLQYVALQPGTKIQIRFGYSNNPDLLTPVFTGRVTSYEGDEVLMIEAEEYLAELCELPIKDDKPVKQKTYGGWQPWHDAGDTKSIVQEMLTVDTAKHFGGFRLGEISEPYMQGMTWQKAVGSVIGEFGMSPTNELSFLGAALVQSGDRSGENILINHVINHAGAVVKSRGGRSFFPSTLPVGGAAGSVLASAPGVGETSETSADKSTSSFYLNFEYNIPDNCTKTTWDIIVDICRRYPEYQVLSKQYGFPFGADATLVIGHPLDWYYARPPLIGDDERYHASLTMDSEFQTWWKVQGAEAWAEMIHQITVDKGLLADLHPPTPTNPKDFYATIASLNEEMQQFFGVAGLHYDPSKDLHVGGTNISSAARAILNYADQGAERLLEAVDSSAEMSRVKLAQGEIQAVRRKWESYVEQQNPSSDDRLKPVRRYHFIDHQTIVKNNMRLNSKIHNAVRVGSKTIKVNGAIPSSHTRVLDVTDLIVNSKENVEPHPPILMSVAQSFMKEELGRMYEGEIILRGVPEIEPGDALVLLDPSTFIVGIVEVDHLLHSFNQETGYTTIVYPRAMSAVNEMASASFGRMMSMVMAKAFGSLSNERSLAQTVKGSFTDPDVPGLSGVGAGTAAGVGAAVAGVAVGGAALLGAPVTLTLGILAGIAFVGGSIYASWQSEKANPMLIMPVTRLGRPWIGGLEGYQIADFFQNVDNAFQAFKADEIYPLLDTYYKFKGQSTDTLPAQ